MKLNHRPHLLNVIKYYKFYKAVQCKLRFWIFKHVYDRNIEQFTICGEPSGLYMCRSEV